MGLLRMAARTAVVAGTASATAGAVQHHQQQKYASQEAAAAQQQQPQQYAPAPAAPAAPSADDQLLEIQKLGALRDQGLLTDEEFTAKKAQILGI